MIELFDTLKLNPSQREVALARGHCLAIACPGAGKTSTLAAKAAYLLNEGESVSAVTFTKEAAMELRERIIRYASPGSSSRLIVGTFHSLCLWMAFPNMSRGKFGRSILHGIKSPFETPWKIVETGVQISYINRAIKESGAQTDYKSASALIDAAKEIGSVDHLEIELQDMVNIYCELLQRANKIDFIDIILKTNQALKEGSLSPLQTNYLLCDEWQDTDKAQYLWVKAHAKSGTAVTAVGDDDQSIYGFRRALGYEAMDRFSAEFDATRILLNTNYRCRSEILSSAESLIRKNTHRIDKSLFAHRGEGGVVINERFANSSAEASAVAEEAFATLEAGDTFAAIAHTNREIVDLQKAMILRGVPYKKSDGKSIFDYHEIQVFAGLLRTLIKPTPDDIDMVLAWAGMKDSDTIEVRKVFGNAIRSGSISDFTHTKITADGKTLWRNFAKKHGEWKSLCDQGMNSLLIVGVHEWLCDNLQKPYASYMLDIASELFNPDGKSISEHMERLRLSEISSRNQNKDKENKEENVAWLMTGHGSKGLEFNRCWLVGLNHGAFPSEKSSLEEERRLMFVMMTRAKDVLWISGTNDKKPSIFIKESGLL